MRIPVFLYTNKNLVGSGLAITALGLYLGGIISDFWWAIAAGSYGIGALATPSSPTMEVEMKSRMADAEIIAGLSTIAARARRVVPEAVVPDIEAICNILISLVGATAKSEVDGDTKYAVRTAATDYLPNTINKYTKMPPAFRAIHRGTDGKSADQMLGEQIHVLRTSLEKSAAAFADSDAAELKANGKFLNERFSQSQISEAMT